MLAQAEVSGGDELVAFVPVLDIVPDLRDVVITADALHCQRAHADYLHRRGAQYLFTVEGNQPILRRALARLPWAQAPGMIASDAGHGRRGSGSIKVIDVDGTPQAGLFPHGARAIKVVRRRRCAGQAKPSVQTVYAIPRKREGSPPHWVTATPTPSCWPDESAHTGRSRTAYTR